MYDANTVTAKTASRKGGPDVVGKVVRFDIKVGSTRAPCSLRLLEFGFGMKFFVVFTAKSCRNTPVNFVCLSSLTRKTTEQIFTKFYIG
jgi:hypothetical protein